MLMNAQEMKEKMSEGYIRFSAIIELMGKPKEHAEQTLKDYVAKIKENENFEAISEDYEEPKELEDGFYSVFVELEMLAKNTEELTFFCFDYMPSSIEIIEPDAIKLASHGFTSFLNDLQARLHNMDMTVKKVNATNQKLNSNVEALLKNTIKLCAKTGSDTLPKMSEAIGIAEKELSQILNQLVGAGVLEKKDEKYVFIAPEK